MNNLIPKIVVICAFTFIWIDTFYLDLFLLNILGAVSGVIIPIILLCLILKMESAISYKIVLTIFIISILFEFKELFNYINLSKLENPEVYCSCDPIFEAKLAVRNKIIASIGIIFMLVKPLKSKYLNKNSIT